MYTAEIEVVAAAIAHAIKPTMKFATAEANAAGEWLAKDADENKKPNGQFRANLMRISNVSAVRQELEQAGILPKAKTESALSKAVAIELAG